MDDPTVVPPDWMAVMISPDGKVSICLPKDDCEVPDLWMATVGAVLDMQRNPERAANIARHYEAEAAPAAGGVH